MDDALEQLLPDDWEADNELLICPTATSSNSTAPAPRDVSPRCGPWASSDPCPPLFETCPLRRRDPLTVSWSIIHTYTRAEALADGVLVEVPAKLAAEAGLRLPVACTQAVWEDCVAWTAADTARTGAPQDETGRLWDLLTVTRAAAARAGHTDRTEVVLARVPRDARSPQPQPATLRVVIGPGDDGEPVLTLLFPGED